MRNRQNLVVALCAAVLAAGVFSVAGAVTSTSDYPPTVLTPAITAAMQAVNTTYINRWKAAHNFAPWDGYVPIARFGDSITYSSASFHPFISNTQFWNVTTEIYGEQYTTDWIVEVMPNAAWDWQLDPGAASHGNLSGTTSAWALQTDQAPPGQVPAKKNIENWLINDNPAVAIIQWGTNDVDPANGINVSQYKANMQAIVQACKDYGTIPVLVTIPPRVGYEAQTVGDGFWGVAPRGTYVQAILDLGTEMSVPVIDYNQQILFAHPADWSTTLISSDGINPSAAPNPVPGVTQFPALNFAVENVQSYGYVMRNWLVLHALRNFRMSILPPPSGPINITVFDTQSSDVQGPEPIRVFPIPAAAKVVGATGGNSPNWAGAQLIYDNWAEIHAFSIGTQQPTPKPNQPNLGWIWKTMPFGNSNVTFHNVRQDVGIPASTGYGRVIDDPSTFRYIMSDPTPPVNGVDPVPGDEITDPLLPDPCPTYYVSVEGSDTASGRDNRYPYHIPRVARYHAYSFLSVLCDLATPVRQFGVFLPASSISYSTAGGTYFDDQNFKTQSRYVYVAVVDDQTPPTITRRMVSLKDSSTFAPTYCPFLSITWDGAHRIKQVSIIHNASETANCGVGFMDIYTVAGEPPPAAPSSPSPADAATGVASPVTLSWSEATSGATFDVYLGTTNPPGKVVTGQTGTTYNPGTLTANTTYYWKVVATTTGGSTSSPVWSFTTAPAVQPLVGDINHDYYVNVGDLQLLVGKWGRGPGYVGTEDINGDGYVNVGDLQLLVANWGAYRVW